MEKTRRYKVIVSDRARMMLAAHVKFMAQASPPAARRVKSDIMAAIRSLRDFPDRHEFVNDEHIPKNKYHKMFVEKWYLLLYQIKDDTVYVDYIIDGRQDYGWLIR